MNNSTTSHPANHSQTSQDSVSPRLPCAFSRAVIKRTAIRLKRFAEFRDLQRCDLQQELWIRLIQQSPLFDDSRAHWHAYVTTVVNRAARNLLRDRRAKKRADGDAAWCTELRDQTADASREFYESDRLRHKGVELQSAGESTELKLDLAEVIRLMPRQLRPIARGLLHRNCPELSRRLKMSETTLRRRIRAIRERLEEHGIHKSSK